ncbi:MAG: NAD(P)-dependent oxidoreductase [Proteobacteria bacterium]|nr:NAD(P)-dependent oxidoreductase [Pseudomonadota bacterium]
MSHVLITGAGGFLGRHLVHQFLNAGHVVRAGDRAQVDLSDLDGVEAVPCELDDDASVRAACEGVDIVVHCAGLFDHAASRELLFAVNEGGCRTVGTIATELGVARVVLVSSTGVYGGKGNGITEDDPKTPTTDYDQSKWAGEVAMTEVCRDAGVPLAVIRPTLIYGPGSRYGMASWLALLTLRAQAGLRSLPLAQGGPFGSHVHVEDVARACLFAAESDAAAGRAFNVSDDTPLAAGDLLRILCGEAGITVKNWGLPWFVATLLTLMRPLVVWVAHKQNPRLAHLWKKLTVRLELKERLLPRIDVEWLDYVLGDHVFDNSALKAAGFEIQHPDTRTGMAEVVAWYRQEHWLP